MFRLSLLVLLISLDQTSKDIISNGPAVILSWGGIYASSNSHAPFSLPLSNTVMVIIVTLTVITLSFWLVPRPRVAWPNQLMLIVLIASGVSNLLDRLYKGGVVDIVHLGSLSTNLADLFIISALCFTLAYNQSERLPVSLLREK